MTVERSEHLLPVRFHFIIFADAAATRGLEAEPRIVIRVSYDKDKG
jgi:hypothetical protein